MRYRHSRATDLIRAALLRLFLVKWSRAAIAQIPPPQLDSSRNNLSYPAGYRTHPVGELGKIEVIRGGAKPLLFIGGWGFGASEFRDYAGAVPQSAASIRSLNGV